MYKWLIFLTIYLPFQLALNPASGVDLASIRVLILLLFFVWLAQGVKKKNVIIRNTLQTWLVASFLFLNLLSIVAAGNTDWSARKLLFLFSIFPLYFIAAGVIDTKEKAKKIMQAAVASGAVVAGIGVIQFLLQFFVGLDATYKAWANYVIAPFLGNSFSQAVLQNPSWLVNIAGKTYLRATATFPDPHMLSFYLGLLIPLSFGIAAEKKNKPIWLFFSVVLLVADLLTFSRGGYLGLFGGALMAIIILWNKLGKKYKIGALAVAALVFAALAIPSPVTQRFYSSFDFKEGSNQGRIETWRQAAGVIGSRPIFGTGIGNYPLAIKPTATYREPIYAHNTYLDIAAETGILNALIWASLLLVVILEFLRKGRGNGVFSLLAISMVIFAIHSLVETAIYSPTVLALFLIIISFSNIKTDEKNN